MSSEINFNGTFEANFNGTFEALIQSEYKLAKNSKRKTNVSVYSPNKEQPSNKRRNIELNNSSSYSSSSTRRAFTKALNVSTSECESKEVDSTQFADDTTMSTPYTSNSSANSSASILTTCQTPTKTPNASFQSPPSTPKNNKQDSVCQSLDFTTPTKGTDLITKGTDLTGLIDFNTPIKSEVSSKSDYLTEININEKNYSISFVGSGNFNSVYVFNDTGILEINGMKLSLESIVLKIPHPPKSGNYKSDTDKCESAQKTKKKAYELFMGQKFPVAKIYVFPNKDYYFYLEERLFGQVKPGSEEALKFAESLIAIQEWLNKNSIGDLFTDNVMADSQGNYKPFDYNQDEQHWFEFLLDWAGGNSSAFERLLKKFPEKQQKEYRDLLKQRQEGLGLESNVIPGSIRNNPKNRPQDSFNLQIDYIPNLFQ